MRNISHGCIITKRIHHHNKYNYQYISNQHHHTRITAHTSNTAGIHYHHNNNYSYTPAIPGNVINTSHPIPQEHHPNPIDTVAKATNSQPPIPLHTPALYIISGKRGGGRLEKFLEKGLTINTTRDILQTVKRTTAEAGRTTRKGEEAAEAEKTT